MHQEQHFFLVFIRTTSKLKLTEATHSLSHNPRDLNSKSAALTQLKRLNKKLTGIQASR